MFTIPPVVYRLSSLSAVSLAALFSATQTLFSGSNDLPRQVFTSELSAYIQGALQAGGVQGLTATAIFANDSASPQFATFGNRSEDGDLVEFETLFYIGSCSKAFVGASLGILMDDFASGKNQTALPAEIKAFTWETKVQDLVTGGAEWKLPDQFSTERANLRDLLAHVTGLSGHDLFYREEDDPEDLLNRMQYLKQNRELRQQWQYNNIMYIIGAHIVSTYAGKPFTEFVQERIFAPLNMTSSYYYASKVPSELSISQSFSDSRRTPLWTADDRLAKLIAGAGGILTNTVDITKWLATLLNSGVNPVNNETIVPKDAFDIITSAYVIEPALLPEASGSVSGYGGGWERFSYRGHEVILHTGGVIGFLSVLAFFPNDGFATFLSLNNGWAAETLRDVASKIFDSLLGLSSDLSTPSARTTTSDTTSDATDADTTATVDLSAYAGTYTDAGYGNITFCAPASTSSSCIGVLANFSSIIPNITASSGLCASWDRFWTKSAMLVPVSGNSWKFSTFNIYPHGFGKDTTPFTDSYFPEPFQAVFDVEGGEVKGFGIFGGFIGAILDGEAEESIPVKNRAEVYFSKV